MNYSNSWLISRMEKEGEPKFLFFWGHQPSKDGSITKTCFSQWWLSPFMVAGETFATAEHWMMAAKARLFGDEAIRDKILVAESPGEVKKLGRMIAGFDSAAWDREKYGIVVGGNYAKFSSHEPLKTFLLSTGDRVLVEASPVDPVWGIGLAADHQDAPRPDRWRGENLLGYALMEVRDRLSAENKSHE